MRGVDRLVREWEREADAEREALRGAWADFADELRRELAERDRCRREPPAPLAGLSRHAAMVLSYLHASEGGRTYLLRLEQVVPAEAFHAGLIELLDAGLVKVSPAVDEDGQMREVILSLDYGVDLPGTE